MERFTEQQEHRKRQSIIRTSTAAGQRLAPHSKSSYILTSISKTVPPLSVSSTTTRSRRPARAAQQHSGGMSTGAHTTESEAIRMPSAGTARCTPVTAEPSFPAPSSLYRARHSCGRKTASRVCFSSAAPISFSSFLLCVVLVAIHWMAPAVEAQLHFVSLGNWGSGDGGQRAVASALKAKAREDKLSLMVSPGSNFLNGGVNGVNDTRWAKYFERPYESSELRVPFFTVLGAEDWAGDHTAQALYAEQVHQKGVEETKNKTLGPQWMLPNWWYYYYTPFSDASGAGKIFSSADSSVVFVFVDTHILSDDFPYQNVTQLHWNDLNATISQAVAFADWVIVVGDKAMLSSGASKGDNYLASTLRPLLKEAKVDAYISGNDYDMEVIEDGPLLHINCGTGSSHDALPRIAADNSVIYVGRTGFCHHVLTKKSFTTEFIEADTGKVVESYKKEHNHRERVLLDRYHRYRKMPEVRYVPIIFGAGGAVADESDAFIRVCGTIGLLTASFFVCVAAVICGHRAIKMAS